MHRQHFSPAAPTRRSTANIPKRFRHLSRNFFRKFHETRTRDANSGTTQKKVSFGRGERNYRSMESCRLQEQTSHTSETMTIDAQSSSSTSRNRPWLQKQDKRNTELQRRQFCYRHILSLFLKPCVDHGAGNRALERNLRQMLLVEPSGLHNLFPVRHQFA